LDRAASSSGLSCRIVFLNTVINQSIIITTLFYKIPPHLPFPKGGTIPLFGKEGLREIFRRICLLYYGLINNRKIPPDPPLPKREMRSLPFVKGDLEGFLQRVSCSFDVTPGAREFLE
jgi:hypothetical protein